ncbi:hypothetical protein PHJA_000392900 [Phtheirospermum japonicum]|uniref:Uncharacterized protein n=1 Tax=Phtheirospermum japonicum TaxID=374723 RepID=A0A830BBA7_9LAMI|nr:hypothetical protein PHJA_000392900 [Phtheirospermum japonicum]
MLFFSCTLFITLVLSVHLLFYFPIISSFLSLSEVISPPIPSFCDLCIFSLHNIMYSDDRECQIGCKRSWDWIKMGRVAECDFQKLRKPYESNLLNGSWVVIAGDSQAKLMVVSFLELLMRSESVGRLRSDLFMRHNDYSMVVQNIGMKLDFISLLMLGI